jgi:hypothetical protein
MQIQAVVIRANNEVGAALAAMTKNKAGAVIVQSCLTLCWQPCHLTKAACPIW